MANTKKYVSLDKLSLYDEKIKKVISDSDAAALASAKEYADGLAGNYEAAGSVATAQTALQKNIDAVQANVDTAAAAAAQAQSEVDALETLVGTLPSGTTATSVVAYVDAKTANIASDETVNVLAGRVTQAEADIDNIEKDYLKAADKTELSDAIAAEAARADAAEKKNAADIKAIADDYLKAADKTELEGKIDAVVEDVAEIAGDYLKAADKTELNNAIALKADKTALDAVSAVANAAATQTALQGEIDRAKGEEARIEGLVTAEAERAAQAEAGLQTQINTIMNNPDTEGVINSINEFTKYIEDHGEIAEGFRADIDANAKAIEDHEALAAQTYETKEDATAKFDELSELVNAKAVQADWNQNDSTAADFVKNRTHYESTVVVNEPLNITWDGNTEGLEYVEAFDGYKVSDVVLTEENLRNADVSIADVNNGQMHLLETGRKVESPFDGAFMLYGEVPGMPNGVWAVTINEAIASQLGATAGTYFTIRNSGEYYTASFTTTEPVEHVKSSVVQLDEKFIPDTIARVSDVDAVAERMTNAEGKISTLEGKVSANETAIAELKEADAGIIERVAAVEAQLGDGEGSVADLIADAKAELQAEMATAIEGAKTDASNKDAVVLAETQKYTDAEIDKVEVTIATMQTAVDGKAAAADLTALAGRVTTVEGKVSTLETEMDAVEALAAAADAAAKANATAIALKADITALNAVSDRVTAIETWHSNFVEVSEEDINALFTA